MTLRLAPLALAPPLETLIEIGSEEGWGFLPRLRDEWQSGVLRFEAPGEVLLGAWQGERLVGIGGISLDPYSDEPRLGRVRHVYVLPDQRGGGTGRLIVTELIERSRGHFDALRLRTTNPKAAALYESLGFLPSDAPDESHRFAYASSAIRP